MRNGLEGFLKGLSFSRIKDYDEANTKQAIVLPILYKLGWNVFNVEEVEPEYSVGRGKVDYALKGPDGKIEVLMEVKAPREPLSAHQEQLLGYAFRKGADLAVLTNGVEWWFYLPMVREHWEDRLFLKLNLIEGDPKRVARTLREVLGKRSVSEGRAYRYALELHRRGGMERLLTEVWEGMLESPDGKLVDALTDKIRKEYGIDLTGDEAAEFVKRWYGKVVAKAWEKVKGYTGKKPTSIVLLGEEYPVRSWKEVLVKTAEVMYRIHGKNFWRRVKDWKGRRRRYFSQSPDGMRVPARIPGTKIYVETHMNALTAVRLSRALLSRFGYNGEDLKIITEEKDG